MEAWSNYFGEHKGPHEQHSSDNPAGVGGIQIVQDGSIHGHNLHDNHSSHHHNHSIPHNKNHHGVFWAS